MVHRLAAMNDSSAATAVIDPTPVNWRFRPEADMEEILNDRPQ